MSFFKIFHNRSPNKQITKQYIKEKIEIDQKTIIIVQGKVYDITLLVDSELHPGGNICLQEKNGTDCTEDLKKFHSLKANNILKMFYIGDFIDDIS